MKHYVLADGRQLRQCSGDTWQLMTLNGEHVCYLRNETIDYSTVRGPR